MRRTLADLKSKQERMSCIFEKFDDSLRFLDRFEILVGIYYSLDIYLRFSLSLYDFFLCLSLTHSPSDSAFLFEFAFSPIYLCLPLSFSGN